MTIDVTLSFHEIAYAAQAGIMRRIDSMEKNLQKIQQAETSGWNIDIDGACAELAVAKALNMHWGGHVGSFKAPDVGELHIRSTNHANGQLIIRKNDPDEYVYMLVICKCPDYKIIGGMSGRKAKAREITKGLNGKMDCWFIPQDDLFTAEEIFARIKWGR